jgi:hypothetical protein
MIRYDLGQMTMQMTIAAAGLGIGSAMPRSRIRIWRADRSVSPMTGSVVVLITLGYPAERPLDNMDRRPSGDVVSRGRS